MPLTKYLPLLDFDEYDKFPDRLDGLPGNVFRMSPHPRGPMLQLPYDDWDPRPLPRPIVREVEEAEEVEEVEIVTLEASSSASESESVSESPSSSSSSESSSSSPSPSPSPSPSASGSGSPPPIDDPCCVQYKSGANLIETGVFSTYEDALAWCASSCPEYAAIQCADFPPTCYPWFGGCVYKVTGCEPVWKPPPINYVAGLSGYLVDASKCHVAP